MKKTKTKIVFHAWKGKNQLMTELMEWREPHGNLAIGNVEVFQTKGAEHLWDSEDWPPEEIKITIEKV
jgi:hypothetical protein